MHPLKPHYMCLSAALFYSNCISNDAFIPFSFQVLINCSLKVPSGSLWMLLGPNGCGKSSLLKVRRAGKGIVALSLFTHSRS